MTQPQALEILKSGKNVFLTGEPGAGKTFVTNLFRDWLAEQGKNYAITASMGIAATHINGTTIHSWSGLGIKRKVNKAVVDHILENRFLTQRIRQCQVLIIDEVSMLDARFINNLDALLCAVRLNRDLFGGVQIVFVGDFFQLPPVVPDEETHFAFEADAWKQAGLEVCYLTEQHRQNDQKFLEILTAMRKGEVTDAHKALLLACTMNKVPDTHLYTHNFDVDRVNEMELQRLPGKLRKYKAETSGIPWMIEVLKKSCLSPEYLELKMGAVVMFTKNNFQAGYVNGTIGKIIGFEGPDRIPRVQLADGTVVLPEMAHWQIEEKGEVKASFEQWPLRLAWAITVHKSQGMSLDSASINLSKTFEYGQGYVAISRVRSLAGLHLQGMNDKVFATHPEVVKQDLLFREAGGVL